MTESALRRSARIPSALVARRESSYMRDMASKRAFRIGRSRTGLGLFAKAPIKKGVFIVEYKGRKLTNEQADKLEARGNRYLYEINSRWTIDGTSRKNLGRTTRAGPMQDPHDRPQGHHTRHQEHQNRCRDYLQLRPRLSDHRHHAAWLQMRQVPEATSRCSLEGTRQGPMSRTRRRRPMPPDSSRGSGWARTTIRSLARLTQDHESSRARP
jgi:hypothetical protein